MIPTEFISLAGRFVSMGAGGARSAVSRAYYGAFHVVRGGLVELGVQSPRSGITHVLVSNYLISTEHVTCVQIGRSLSRLQNSRITADYDLDDSSIETTAIAKLSVESAVEVVALFQSFQHECQANDLVRQKLLEAVAKVDAVRQGRK